MTVPCWNCSADLDVNLGALWGVCWTCRAATGLDGLRYQLAPAPYWPVDDPSGPRYVAQPAFRDEGGRTVLLHTTAPSSPDLCPDVTP